MMTCDTAKNESCRQTAANELNPEKCPLNGITIVEAGAGTGKTYTIQKLVLRILLEEEVPLPKILVVTFTVAATGELLDRLHAILVLAKDALESDRPAEDIFKDKQYEQISGILQEQHIESPDNRKKCLNLVRDALQDYDQAAVMTIHGFCQRMLQDNAMQSFIRYGLEMRTDYSDVDRKIAMDFCRSITYSAGNPSDDLSDGMLVGSTITPELLLNNMSCALSNAFNGATIEFPGGEITPEKRKELAKKIKDKNFWDPLKSIPDDSLKTDGKKFLAQNFAVSFPGLVAQICSEIDNGRMNYVLSVAKQMSKDSLSTCIQDAALLNENFNSFFDTLDDIRKCASAAESSIGREFLAFYKEELEKYKAKEGFLTFNDLIRKMADIVDSPEGESLCESIRNAFSFVFVDEFQDTDPCQYRIFSKIFGKSSDHGFFMIGDPKQAIYSFRGGDVYTYLNAVDEVRKIASAEKKDPQCYTLTKNYRSSKKYIESLNRFYDKQNNPFNNSKIGFSPIVWGGTVKSNLYCDGNLIENPLEFSKRKKKEDVINWVVSKVQNLLSGRYSIKGDKEDRPVSANDIAILFPSKSFGTELEKALNEKNIDTVWMSESNIFQLPEAQIVWRFLKMLYDGVRIHDMVSVLSDGLFMFTANEIRKITSEPDAAEGPGELAQQYFLELRKIWEQKGIHAMFRKLLNEPNSSRKWIQEVRESEGNSSRFQDDATLAVHIYQSDNVLGPYTLGHIRQLADKLHTAARRHHLTPGGLLIYLRSMINKETHQEDSGLAQHVQRNTDQPAVRLMTLHSSKGLEFPIVLLPNVPTHQPVTLNNKKVVQRLYHNGNQRTVNMTGWLSEQETGIPEPDDEFLEEKLRLLYVGLTRAKYACYVPYRQAYTGVTDKIPLTEFPESPKSENTTSTPSPASQKGVQNNRIFNGKFVFDWQNGSFSSFSKGYHLDPNHVSAVNDGNAVPIGDESGGDDERSEIDEISAAESDADVPDDEKYEPEDPNALPGDSEQKEIFAFARGEKAGTSWHEIFELMDLQPEGLSAQDVFIPETDLKLLEKLPKKSLYTSIRLRRDDDEDAPKRDQAFARMLKGILCNPLTAASETFSLKDIPPSQCARELGFRYVLKSHMTLKQIKDCLKKNNIPTGSWADSAEAEYVDWALTGSIDLLCQSKSGKYYVMDWKTNQLNGKLSGFSADGVQREITLKMYTLQYLIYTVALWHFIRERTGIELTRENYDRLFGGVFYLFVRGIAAPLPGMSDLQKENCRKRGIFYTLPPFELIAELKQLLEIRSRTNDTERN